MHLVRNVHYKVFLHIKELTEYMNENKIHLDDVKIINAHECYVLLYQVTTVENI